MENFGFGLQMMLLGMGTVFLMLIALMAVLMLLGKTDRPAPVALPAGEPDAPALDGPVDAVQLEDEDPNAWMTIADASGLTPEQIAAVAVAVSVHADVRRKQGAPANRVHAPGSRLWASRWVSMGRSSQMHNTQRR